MSENNILGGNQQAPQVNPEEIQNKVAEIQKALASLQVEGSAGIDEYKVQVSLNGRYEATKVVIDPNLLKEPTEVLCDLIASAITDASRKAESMIQAEMMGLMKNFG